MILDLFAGPGGWDIGDGALGLTTIGIEHDAEACQTRANVGLSTIRADVANFPISHFLDDLDGLIASPPCQAFSRAGKRKGHLDADRLYAHLDACVEEWTEPPADGWEDPRSPLILQPVRYAWELMPRWIACEQVTDARPFFERMAEILTGYGYSTWCGVLNAADYGVPQTRKRVILMARLDGPVAAPPATHTADPNAESTLFGALEPWVTMAEALGWTDHEGRVGFPRKDDLGTSPDGYRERDWRSINEPSNTITEKARSWMLDRRADYVDGQPTIRLIDPAEEPSPTVTGTALSAGVWRLVDIGRNGANRTLDEPVPTICASHDNGNLRWTHERPATTVVGDSRLWPPGHKINQADIDRLGETEAAERYGDRAGTNAIRLTIDHALALQTFPVGYPLAGTRTAQFRQVGDAVPPLLAYHVLKELTQ